MVPILVASNTGYAGRTFITLGLALKLMDMGYKVGVMKLFGTAPVQSGKDSYDADALFFKETLKLEEPLDMISPFARVSLWFWSGFIMFPTMKSAAAHRIAPVNPKL